MTNGGIEACDGIDNDCDAVIDEGVKNTYYLDADDDGYGDPNNTAQACTAPAGYVAENTDCNDSDGSVNPGAEEVCDGIDNDCDGVIDPAGVGTIYYRDSDRDGYGDPDNIQHACTQPPGYVMNDQDCDDTDPDINPVAIELPCNGVDENCDGFVDGYDPGSCTEYFLTCLSLLYENTEYKVDLGIRETLRRELVIRPAVIAFEDTDGLLYDYDIKACGLGMDSYTWVVRLDLYKGIDPENLPLLSWDSAALPEKAGYEWKIIDADNNILAYMGLVDSYEITGAEGDYLSIVWAESDHLAVEIPLNRGWNLCSLPLSLDNSTRKSVFPDALDVWHFDQDTQSYRYIIKDDIVRPGLGYWVLLRDPVKYTYTGLKLREYSLNLTSGWHMIGALYDRTTVSVAPGAAIEYLYGYDPNSVYPYTDADPTGLEMGRGYWVLPSQETVFFAKVGSKESGVRSETYSQNRSFKEAYSDIWSFDIIITGQEREFYLNKTAVKIGLSSSAYRFSSPPPPPKTTVFLSIRDLDDNSNFIRDMRSADMYSHAWVVMAMNNTSTVTDPNFLPVLSWRVPGSIEGSIELRRGSSGTGEVLVADMKAVRSYQIRPGDGSLFTVAWNAGCGVEICDGMDNDCDGLVDEDFDTDADGYTSCGGDCVDTDAGINPDAEEVCDSVDNNCNGFIDEEGASGCTTYFRDSDKDAYGVDTDKRCLCAPEGDYAATAGGDCEDSDPAVNPGAFEILDDGIDNNCDGLIDEMALRVVNGSGYPGQTDAVVAVEILNGVDVAGGDIILRYDPNILVATGVVFGPILDGFLTDSYIVHNTGRINIVIANYTGITANSGILFEVLFDVPVYAPAGSKVPITFEEARLNDQYGNLFGVVMKDGVFEVLDRCPKGDVNRDGAIFANDAILTLQYIAGKLTPNTQQGCSADVNNDGFINVADAILILKAAVGKETIFYLLPESGYPESYVSIKGWNFGDHQGGSLVYFNNLPATPVSWCNREIVTQVPLGVGPGHVVVTVFNPYGFMSNYCIFNILTQGGSRRSRSLNRSIPPDTAKAMSLPSVVETERCKEFTIPVEVDDASDIAGIDILIQYDSSIVEFEGIDKTTLTDKFYLIHTNMQDKLRVVMASHEGIGSGSGALVNVRFKPKSDALGYYSNSVNIENVYLFDNNALSIDTAIFDTSQLIISKGTCDNPVITNSNWISGYLFTINIDPLMHLYSNQSKYILPVAFNYSKKHIPRLWDWLQYYLWINTSYSLGANADYVYNNYLFTNSNQYLSYRDYPLYDYFGLFQ